MTKDGCYSMLWDVVSLALQQMLSGPCFAVNTTIFAIQSLEPELLAMKHFMYMYMCKSMFPYHLQAVPRKASVAAQGKTGG